MNNKKESATIKDLKNNTYANFDRHGVTVDLVKFFKTVRWQEALKKVSNSAFQKKKKK